MFVHIPEQDTLRSWASPLLRPPLRFWLSGRARTPVLNTLSRET